MTDDIQTPFKDNGLTDEKKIEKIESLFSEIMDALGMDRADDSLVDTPKRVAKMYVKEFFKGLDQKNFPKMTFVENKMKMNEMVCVRGIKVMSVCEHHFVTIHGNATVAYIPDERVLGLSKINRIVDYYSRRPQVQERLTKQIADCLMNILKTENIAVHIDAKHYCVIARGIEDQNSMTSSCDLRGIFKGSSEARAEFLKNCILK